MVNFLNNSIIFSSGTVVLQKYLRILKNTLHLQETLDSATFTRSFMLFSCIINAILQ